MFNNVVHRSEKIINANEIKNKVLSLPLYTNLEDKDILYICEVIKEFFTIHR
ncbi:MAG: hypothetical protein HY738_02560 [Bacteroidia bacterium]|nr:hypothetical protein [Bacteroidia bacterium]